MPQNSNYTALSTYYSTTPGQAPSNTKLVNGELALNITDGKLYYKDNLGAVQLLASKDFSSNVTFVSVVSTNGFAGTVANPSTTPAITLSTTIAAGMLKSNGSGAILLAGPGVDYAPATSGTAILYGDGSGGFSSVTIGSNLTFVGGTLNSTGGSTSAFPAGTIMLFRQTAAPTGWTKDTTNFNDSALRVVTGSVSSGGSVGFTTAFASQAVSGSVSISSVSGSVSVGGSVGSTTLSASQLPSHTHGYNNPALGTVIAAAGSGAYSEWGPGTTNGTGSGTSHTHSFSGSGSFSFSSGSASFSGTAINLAVKYCDVIFAIKD